MDEEELTCSVCYELPLGQVHQCTRGHFLCVGCWNDLDKLPRRICPECRVPVPKANRNKVAELAIRYLPRTCTHCGEENSTLGHERECKQRPDAGRTPTQPSVNNRGAALTPILEQAPEIIRHVAEERARRDERHRRRREEAAAGAVAAGAQREEAARQVEAARLRRREEVERRHREAVRQMEEANQALTAWLERLEHATERRNAHGAPPAAGGEAAPSPRAVVRTQVRTAAVDAVAAATAAGAPLVARRIEREQAERQAAWDAEAAEAARRAEKARKREEEARRRAEEAAEAARRAAVVAAVEKEKTKRAVFEAAAALEAAGPSPGRPQPSPASLVMNWGGVDRFSAIQALGNNDLSVDRALVELTDTAGLNGAARKKAAKKKKQKEARKAELEAALQEARDEGNGGDSDDPRVAQMKWLQESGGA